MNDMATIKSSFLNLLIVLTVITLAAGIALGYVYEWTKEPIARAQMAKQLEAIEAVVKGYDNNPVLEKFKVRMPDGRDSLEFFPARLKGEMIGVAVKTKSSKGYSGDVWIMVGFNMQGDILNIVVMEHKETPGLGSKMTEPSFLNQFFGRNPAEMKLKLKKDGGAVDGITGATVTSRAFAEAVQAAYDTFQSTNHVTH
jgi:electron transport complex protein RnfG